MRNRKENKSGLFLVHFSSGKEGEDDLRELVHHGDHCLPMAETFIPLLVIISTEERRPDDGFLGHDVDILPEAPVPVLCYILNSSLITMIRNIKLLIYKKLIRILTGIA